MIQIVGGPTKGYLSPQSLALATAKRKLILRFGLRNPEAEKSPFIISVKVSFIDFLHRDPDLILIEGTWKNQADPEFKDGNECSISYSPSSHTGWFEKISRQKQRA